MLPTLDRLRLSRTGEFYPLSQPELDEFAAQGKQDPITFDPFQRDSNDWRTFRVRNATPRADGTYMYHYYKASTLWRYYDSPTPKKDPLTNQPIWYEDWMALHDVYDPSPNATGSIPFWVYDLPTREPGTVKARPPPPRAHAPHRVYVSPSWESPAEMVEYLRASRNRDRERFYRYLERNNPSDRRAMQRAINSVRQSGDPRLWLLDSRRALVNYHDPLVERMQNDLDQAVARWENEANEGAR